MRRLRARSLGNRGELRWCRCHRHHRELLCLRKQRALRGLDAEIARRHGELRQRRHGHCHHRAEHQQVAPTHGVDAGSELIAEPKVHTVVVISEIEMQAVQFQYDSASNIEVETRR